MREEDVEEEQIAAAFFVVVVKQRLQLAAVIEAYTNCTKNRR